MSDPNEHPATGDAGSPPVAPVSHATDPNAPTRAAARAAREAAQDQRANASGSTSDEPSERANDAQAAVAHDPSVPSTDGSAAAPHDTSASDVAVTAPRDVRWGEPELVRKGFGGSAVSFGIAAVAGSFVVGWLFPLGFVAIVMGILSVRRESESTVLGGWGIALGILSLIYSAGWLWYLGTRLGWWA